MEVWNVWKKKVLNMFSITLKALQQDVEVVKLQELKKNRYLIDTLKL